MEKITSGKKEEKARVRLSAIEHLTDADAFIVVSKGTGAFAITFSGSTGDKLILKQVLDFNFADHMRAKLEG